MIDWISVEDRLPDGKYGQTYLAFLKNETTEGDDHIITVKFADYGDIKEFSRIAALEFRSRGIRNKSEFKRFDIPYSCNDLDGDFCVLTHWAYWNKPESEE